MSSQEDSSEEEFFDDFVKEMEDKWKVPAFPEVLDLEKRKDVGVDEWKNSVIAKLFAPKWIEINKIRDELSKQWNTRSNFVVEAVAPSIFRIQFDNPRDLRDSLSSGPWNIEGFIFSVHNWKANTPIEKFPFNWIKMWVQIYGLPIEKKKRSVLMDIGETFGGSIDADVVGGLEAGGSFGRVLVKYHIKNPLPKDLVVKLGGNNLKIRFKYENIGLFCYFCGLLGHDFKSCRDYKDHPEVVEKQVEGPVRSILRFNKSLRVIRSERIPQYKGANLLISDRSVFNVEDDNLKHVGKQRLPEKMKMTISKISEPVFPVGVSSMKNNSTEKEVINGVVGVLNDVTELCPSLQQNMPSSSKQALNESATLSTDMELETNFQKTRNERSNKALNMVEKEEATPQKEREMGAISKGEVIVDVEMEPSLDKPLPSRKDIFSTDGFNNAKNEVKGLAESKADCLLGSTSHNDKVASVENKEDLCKLKVSKQPIIPIEISWEGSVKQKVQEAIFHEDFFTTSLLESNSHGMNVRRDDDFKVQVKEFARNEESKFEFGVSHKESQRQVIFQSQNSLSTGEPSKRRGAKQVQSVCQLHEPNTSSKRRRDKEDHSSFSIYSLAAGQSNKKGRFLKDNSALSKTNQHSAEGEKEIKLAQEGNRSNIALGLAHLLHLDDSKKKAFVSPTMADAFSGQNTPRLVSDNDTSAEEAGRDQPHPQP